MRDGLPRLAHTVAKAAASDNTGYLDSELELLRILSRRNFDTRSLR